jgi:hypothetical protein
MAPCSKRAGPTLASFLSGYHPPQMDKKALRQWTAARLIDRPTKLLTQWIDAENLRTIECLKVLQSKTHTVRVEWAITNAKKYRAWLKSVRAEVHALRPRPARYRRQQGPRVGLLAREAQVFHGRTQRPAGPDSTAGAAGVDGSGEPTVWRGGKQSS